MPVHFSVNQHSQIFGFSHNEYNIHYKGYIMNLYVGNLSYNTTTDELKAAFASFGSVTKTTIITDRESGRSKGFGFIEMTDGGQEALDALNGADFNGRQLRVNEARPRT